MVNIYERLGVRTIINAKGPSTRLSGSTMRPEVAEAMAPPRSSPKSPAPKPAWSHRARPQASCLAPQPASRVWMPAA